MSSRLIETRLRVSALHLNEPAVKIKVCGITNLTDAEKALEFGADILGFNFYPPSPRCIAPEKARKLSRIAADRFQRRAIRQ